jgi:hypothetical protein
MGRLQPTIYTLLGVLVLTGSGLSPVCRGDGAAQPEPARERALAARKAYEAWAAEFFVGRETALGVYLWSRRWMEAEQYLSRGTAEGPAAAEAHVARMKDLEKVIMPAVAAERRGVESYLAADFYGADAEVFLLEAKAGPAAEATVRAATRRLAAAVLIYDTWWDKRDQREQARSFFSGLFWLRRLREADHALRTTKAKRLAAAEAHLRRARALEEVAKKLSHDQDLPRHFVHATAFERLDAEILVAQAKPDTREEETARLERARARLKAAQAADEARREGPPGSGDLETVPMYSLSWRAAALALATTKGERITANEAHLSRMKELETILEKSYRAGRVNERDLLAATFWRADAEVLVSEAKAP